MNIRQVEAFRAIMKHGSASRAAEALGITQPAVSRLVSELEKTIGFSLFSRTRGRLEPTPECRLFYTDVERTFVGLEVLKHSAAQIRERGPGIVRIANMPGIGLPIVSRAVAAFRQETEVLELLQEVAWHGVNSRRREARRSRGGMGWCASGLRDSSRGAGGRT